MPKPLDQLDRLVLSESADYSETAAKKLANLDLRKLPKSARAEVKALRVILQDAEERIRAVADEEPSNGEPVLQ